MKNPSICPCGTNCPWVPVASVAPTAPAHHLNNVVRCGVLLHTLRLFDSQQMQTTAISDLILQRSQFVRFVQRRVDSLSTAEDILQAAYVRAMEQAAKLRNDESAVAWFYRILRNAVIDHYRHRAVHDRVLEQWAKGLETETPPEPQTEEIVCQCIGNVLQSMKPAYSEVLRKVDLEETSLETFAGKAGITIGNAAVRVHRARQALKKQLIQVCGTCSKHGCLNCTCA
jgi:RNA polymerase sigma factor (sigma-70 family)